MPLVCSGEADRTTSGTAGNATAPSVGCGVVDHHSWHHLDCASVQALTYVQDLHGACERLRQGVKAWMRAQDIAISRAAHEIGIGRNTLSAWLAGGSQVTVRTLEAIARWMDTQDKKNDVVCEQKV